MVIKNESQQEKKPLLALAHTVNQNKEKQEPLANGDNGVSSSSNDSGNGHSGIANATPQMMPTVAVPDSNFDSDEEERKRSSTSLKTTNEVSSYSSSEVFKTVIPLPPPSSIGTTFGGNQSYIRNGQPSLRLPNNNNSNSALGYPSSWNNSGDTPHRRDREPGDIGLSNLGNTCFMNSGLQCLIHTPPLVEYFLSLNNENTQRRSNEPGLVFQFHTMMRNAWVGKSAVLNLQDFKGELGMLFSQFKDTHQHDCQEFLAYTLDALHEQLKNLKQEQGKNIKNDQKAVETKVMDTRRKRPQKDEKDKALTESRGPNMILAAHSSNSKHNAVQSLKNHENHDVDGLPPTKKRKEDPTDLANKGADEWKNHLASNNTVIAKTFQGLYKSTVRCSQCEYVSVTYEPFMYLSLPIPRDVDRQLKVTYINMRDRRSQKFELNVNEEWTVAALKEETVKKSCPQNNISEAKTKCVVALVSNHYVHIMLDDEVQIKNMHERSRNIYVIEVNTNFDDEYHVDCTSFPALMSNLMQNHATDTVDVVSSTTTHSEMNPSTYLDEDWDNEEGNGPLPPLIEAASSSVDSTTENISGEVTMVDDAYGRIEELIMCKICLEDVKVSEIKLHTNCSCYLCKDCLSKSINHYENNTEDVPKKENFLKCAVCCETVSALEFLPVGTTTDPPVITLLLIPVLFRNDREFDSDTSPPQLFGYPWMVRVPSYISAIELYKYLTEINPFPQVSSKYLITSHNGKSCVRCPMECTGCEIPKDGMISLSQKNIAIVMSYCNLGLELMSEIQSYDMSSVEETVSSGWPYRPEEPTIDIHDCLKSFSQIEHLDAHNPWNCPQCKNNQSATKAMAICHLPDYLIVYLKRFVYSDHSSNKLNNRLKFPLTGLDVRDYMAEEFTGKDYIYDLYSCVCHYGGASSGHYTAYGKNPNSGSWHLFNDSHVTSQNPKEEEYTSAYILFYERRGVTHSINDILQKCRSLPDRNITCFGERSRNIGVVPPSPNHLSGGNFQENTSSSKGADYYRKTEGSGNPMDELTLSMASPVSKGLKSPNGIINSPHTIPSLQRALEEDNGCVVSNSSDWETEDKPGNSSGIPTLRNQNANHHELCTSSDSGMEDNQENTPEAGPSSSNHRGDVTSSKLSGNRTLNFSRSRTKNADINHQGHN